MKRILIVDDTTGWVRFHQKNIEYLNLPEIEIDSANSATEALDKIQASIDKPYNVIFTDLQMESNFFPKLAGEWLIEQIKTYKECADTKIVIISATANIKEIAKRCGVLFVPKSVIRNSDAGIYKKFIL